MLKTLKLLKTNRWPMWKCSILPCHSLSSASPVLKMNKCVLTHWNSSLIMFCFIVTVYLPVNRLCVTRQLTSWAQTHHVVNIYAKSGWCRLQFQHRSRLTPTIKSWQQILLVHIHPESHFLLWMSNLCNMDINNTFVTFITALLSGGFV